MTSIYIHYIHLYSYVWYCVKFFLCQCYANLYILFKARRKVLWQHSNAGIYSVILVKNNKLAKSTYLYIMVYTKVLFLMHVGMLIVILITLFECAKHCIHKWQKTIHVMMFPSLERSLIQIWNSFHFRNMGHA